MTILNESGIELEVEKKQTGPILGRPCLLSQLLIDLLLYFVFASITSSPPCL